MKLYILTSTLNFHSILATESCSPLACYERRGFGDSFFYRAGSFYYPNTIVLFNKYPCFNMPYTEEEQYSLVIEIDTDSIEPFVFLKVKTVNDIDIYQTSKTIYLNPVGCKFIFENFNIQGIVLAKAKRSMDIKSLFYEEAGDFVSLSHYSVDRFDYSKNMLEVIKDEDFDIENLLRDQRINKSKGFMYAYVIGANTSPGENISHLMQIKKELSNIVHARIINQDMTLQTEKLNILRKEYQQGVDLIDPQKCKIKESAERLNGSTFEQLKKELINLGVWNIVSQRMYTLPDIQYLSVMEDWESINHEADNFLNNALLETQKNLLIDQLPTLDKDSFPIALSLKNISAIEETIFIEWVKMFLNVECTLEIFFGNKAAYLKNAGIKAKEIMGDDVFSQSLERSYYNGLIKNIREAEDFNLLSIHSIVWQSLAICAKATSLTIEAIENLLVSYAIEDYRYSMAIWGAMCGYADMPKTFYNQITKGLPIKESFDYVREVSKRINGFQIDEYEVPKKNINEVITSNVTTQNIVYNHNISSIVRERLNEFEKERGKPLSKNAREAMFKVLNESQDMKSFLSRMGNSSGFKKGLGKAFLDYLQRMHTSNKPKERTLFDDEQNEYKLPDLKCLHSYAFPQKANESLEKNWEVAAKKEKYMSIKHINYFINICKKEGRGEYKKYQGLKGLFTEEVAKLVEEELKKKCNDR